MSSIVEARCPGCANLLRIPADWLHDSLRCKHCHTIFQARRNTVPVSVTTVRCAQPTEAALTVLHPAAPALPIPQPAPAALPVAHPLGTAPAPVPTLATGAGLFMAHQQVRRPAYELWCALIVVLAISGLYVGLALPSVPKP